MLVDRAKLAELDAAVWRAVQFGGVDVVLEEEEVEEEEEEVH